jgi:hypothetical protein
MNNAVFFPVNQVRIFLLLAAGLAGCGKYVPVEGIVRLDGQPLGKATISFMPQEKSKEGPRDAVAVADNEGRFHMKTNTRDGIIPGHYKVIVSKRVPPKGLENPKNMAEAVKATHNSVESVPERYTRVEKSPLDFDVPKGGLKGVELNLQGKP